MKTLKIAFNVEGILSDLDSAPTDPAAVPRLHELAMRHRWDLFFLTDRGHTSGASVQHETQSWLRNQGYDLPNVLTIHGSRGLLADALGLDFSFHTEIRHCKSVLAQSSAKPILVLPSAPDPLQSQADLLGIKVLSSSARCLGFLEDVETSRASHSRPRWRLRFPFRDASE